MSASNKWLKGQQEDWDPLIVNGKRPNRLPLVDVSKFGVVEIGGKVGRLQNSPELRSVTRLLVIVPNLDVDEAAISRQIWILASNYRLNIMLLTMVHNEDESMTAARRLATIAAMTRDTYSKVETHIVFGHSWKKTVKTYWQQTDMILCPSEQIIFTSWGRKNHLSQVLSDDLKAPVYTFSDLYRTPNPQIPYWLRRLPYWLVFLLIIVVSFYFEVNVDQTAKGVVGQVLLIMVVMFEIGLIYVWTLIAG